MGDLPGRFITLITVALLSVIPATRAEVTQLFWGDTHLHTRNSMDAYFMQNSGAGPRSPTLEKSRPFTRRQPERKGRDRARSPRDPVTGSRQFPR